jgi:midasin (ATPase involved in ribosome maturation)
LADKNAKNVVFGIRTMRRLSMIARHLSNVSLGDVSLPVGRRTDRVPTPALEYTQPILQHLQWMMKKDSLGQDMFLLGPPGPFKRRLAMTYLALTGQELEYIALHPDTSAESDLKQRREIVTGLDGQKLKWVDGSCVRAACYGRVLVIEGIEKAERNVLPVLNNLLENREMTLEDGRHIIASTKYDELLVLHGQEQMDAWGLIRAHERFRVIAIGSPVPPYPGKPLDPPFRSRFQVRYVDSPLTSGEGFVNKLSRVIAAVRVGQTIDTPLLSSDNLVPGFHQCTAKFIEEYVSAFPMEQKTHFWSILRSYWPSSWVKKELPISILQTFKELLDKFHISHDGSFGNYGTSYHFKSITNGLATFVHESGHEHSISIITGNQHSLNQLNFIETDRCMDLLSRMVQTHAINQDMLLLGSKSSSKTICISKFAELLGYTVSTIHLYRDITARDLLQRRNTRIDGSTYWEDSPLVEAAKKGNLVVLEGMHWISSEVLSGVASLLEDREMPLPDGSRLVKPKTYERIMAELNFSDQDMRERGIFCVHPAFRIIGTAIHGSTESDWFSEEVGGFFRVLQVGSMTINEERQLLPLQSDCPESKLDKIMRFAEKFRTLSSSTSQESVLSKSISLSTRQLIRISKRAAFPNSDLYTLIHSACLSPFLPHLARSALDEILLDVGIRKRALHDSPLVIKNDQVLFGDVKINKYQHDPNDLESLALIPHSVTKVPSEFGRTTAFFDNPTQGRIMRALAIDFSLGEHMLLIGNQGNDY